MFRGSSYEVAGIFRRYGEQYIEKHKQPAYILKTIRAIEKCRTSSVGGHLERCDSCGDKRISYNSCRNRHCPKCQLLAREKWITYCKQPFGGPERVINYLGRYTHRVAISSQRIKSIEKGEVKFSYKDYRDSNKAKQMRLEAGEFIRRFLLHILPDNFYKIRYYGILSSRNKKTKPAQCRETLGVKEKIETESVRTKSWKETLYELTGVDLNQCPKCRKGRMILVEKIMPAENIRASPPPYGIAITM